MSSILDKLKDGAHTIQARIDKLPDQLDAIKVSVETKITPNFRHDEPEEKEHDHKQQAIRDSHRYGSFARERVGNEVKSYSDGHDTWWAISEILESAREVICIQGWWVTPELYLRRPPADNEMWRLDRILKRKAEAGVKIYMIIYKEVAAEATMNSAHTKHSLEDLHANIAVIRHPDHWQGETTLLWSHHQKVVLVDNVAACIGGLDLCFGRWDTHNHPTSDVFLTDFRETVFPGQDYNNARIKDFTDVQKWTSNQESRLEIARMPWHDVHTMLIGPVVMDICQHFVERWNFIRNVKYTKKGDRYPVLAFPHVVPEDHPNEDFANPDHEPIVRHPHWQRFKDMGKQYILHSKLESEGGVRNGGLGQKGNMNVQVVRSCGDWSNGTLTEHSVMNAYIQLIRESNHFIYIENQFFVTTGKSGAVKNLIGGEIAQRIISAARSEQQFLIIVVIPAVPGFAGELNNPASASTGAIMDSTYKSISRGDGSIYELVRKAGYDASKYIKFYNLRSFDRINCDGDVLKQMESQSGFSYYETQAALARIWLGDNPNQQELNDNKTVTFKLAQTGDSIVAVPNRPDLQPNEGGILKVNMPQTVEEAKDVLRRFSAAAPDQEPAVETSIAHTAMQGGGDVRQMTWLGSEQTQKDAYVTEELYIHSKLMIVDDRKVIIGSANLNDRSMMGNRDSEIAIVIEDQDMVETSMAGKPFYASTFALNFRRKLFMEHLGLLTSQPSTDRRGQVEPTRNMLPVGIPYDEVVNQEGWKLVEDPFMAAQLFAQLGNSNAEAFEKVFHCVPARGLETWNQYKEFVPDKTTKIGHVADHNMSLGEVQNWLSNIKGHVVEMPLDFISKNKLYEENSTVNSLTMEVYV